MYAWGLGTVALALGYGSLYNHSYEPNARYEASRRRTKIFVALRKIATGEEITINYNGEPGDRSPVWFEILEQEGATRTPESPSGVMEVPTSAARARAAGASR